MDNFSLSILPSLRVILNDNAIALSFKIVSRSFPEKSYCYQLIKIVRFELSENKKYNLAGLIFEITLT
ncbi:hypothetical protein GCM10008015_10710 [Flavobacterium palustre]|uniref:Uncharacterized protein n=1 Tax=Flavobacterium palustre TaxID=1476463 RepID=A0ABQ1HD42_9FLAO|nr:hypothetical protein GCM10008015_10710 [Flavobacterium palustre]